MTASPKLRLFLDAGVPDSVGESFKAAGHEVLLHRDHLPEKSPDALVCTVSELNDCILVAFDGDMKQIAKQHGVTGSRFKKLSLIKLSCFEPDAIKRVTQAMSLIEHEWNYGEANFGAPSLCRDFGQCDQDGAVMATSKKSTRAQRARFIKAAREAGASEDMREFEENLRRVVSSRPPKDKLKKRE